MPDTERRFLFLVNQGAGDGQAVHRLERLLRHPPLSWHQTTTTAFVDDHGLRRGLEGLEGETIPVVVGGDGTVAWVVRAWRDAGLQRPLGIVPLGTGNGVAHSLGIGNLRHAAVVLTRGLPRAVDLLVTTHPQAPVCLLNLSVGLESLVMADMAVWRSRSAILAGLLAGGRHALRRGCGVRVEADGQIVLESGDPFCNVGLYNMPCYGFGVRPRPEADPADGAADLRLHRSRLGYWATMGAALAAPAGLVRRAPWPRVRRATIAAALPVQADGETLSPATFQVEVVPRGLPLLAP